MNTRAWVLLLLVKDGPSLSVRGVGVFSEARPTQCFRSEVYATLREAQGSSYEDATRKALRSLYFEREWVDPLLLQPRLRELAREEWAAYGQELGQ